MTSQEQANRTADLVLELTQARRKLAAIRALTASSQLYDEAENRCVAADDILDILDHHLTPEPHP